ncbi:MAG: DUF3857 domain-containing protein [Daejeonella sp.]
MKKLYLFVLLLLPFINAFAQEDYQSFGKVDDADLEMKACAFDKEADAMVLFEKGQLYFSDHLDVFVDYHKRLKIFNDKGKDQANIRLQFYSGDNIESISNVKAQTISLNEKGEKVIQKVEGKLIYNEKITDNITAVVFSFPNVQPGSILEYKYTLKTNFMNLPDWYFQSDIPTRYSYLSQEVIEIFDYTAQVNRNYPVALDRTDTYSRSFFFGGASPSPYLVNKRELAFKNLPALKDEPYMTSDKNYLQGAKFQLNRVKRPMGGYQSYISTWEKLGEELLNSESYGTQLRRKLPDTEDFIAKTKTLSSDELKAAAAYDFVRKNMKWNESNTRGTTESVNKAWQKHTGTSGEMNLILLNILNDVGVKAKPLLVSTRDHGSVNIGYPFLDQFNKTVAYVPLANDKKLVLDATEPYLPYNLIAYDILNTTGFVVSKEPAEWVNLKIETPGRLNVSMACDINPDGSMKGTANLYSSDYNRIGRVGKIKDAGEEKFKDFLKDGNANLEITKLTLDNVDADSLSLVQTVDFKTKNTSEDENYIFFNPNLFLGLSENPFIKDKRITDVDLGYLRSYSLTGTFKIPAGFAADELPKNITMVTPDESVMMRRMVIADGQNISYRFTLSLKKPVYTNQEYGQLHELYKKMYDILGEQFVLKKI